MFLHSLRSFPPSTTTSRRPGHEAQSFPCIKCEPTSTVPVKNMIDLCPAYWLAHLAECAISEVCLAEPHTLFNEVPAFWDPLLRFPSHVEIPFSSIVSSIPSKSSSSPLTAFRPAPLPYGPKSECKGKLCPVEQPSLSPSALPLCYSPLPLSPSIGSPLLLPLSLSCFSQSLH